MRHRAGIGIGPARRLHGKTHVIDGEQRHGARRRHRRQPFGRIRPAGAAAAVTDGDLALQFRASLGRAAVTGEAHRTRQRGRQISGGAGRDVVQEFERRGAAIGRHYAHAGGRHRHFVQRHRLAIGAVLPRRLQFRRFEPAFHQIDRARMAGAAGIAAFHRITAQFGSVGQPRLGISVRFGERRGGKDGGGEEDVAHWGRRDPNA